MGKDRHAPTGRPRSGHAAIPELEQLQGLDLARWASGCVSGGLTMGATASLAGYSRRHLQRVIQAHAHDPLVRRHQLEAEALAWEREGGQALREATSRATSWLRQATSNPEADPREVAAALSAAVASGHRLAEAGARRAKRLAPAEQPQAQRFDLQGFLSTVATACSEIRQQLPPDQQGQAFEQLHQQLRSGDQQGQADPIDVQVIEAQALRQEPPACPL